MPSKQSESVAVAVDRHFPVGGHMSRYHRKSGAVVEMEGGVETLKSVFAGHAHAEILRRTMKGHGVMLQAAMSSHGGCLQP